MLYKVFLPLILSLCALPLSKVYAVFGWFNTMSTKAERAKKVLEGFDEKIAQALIDFNVPGLAIGIVVDGHVIAAQGYGFRDVERKLPATADTIFAIGSCTKAFAAFAIGILVEQGLMGWDQLVCDILPDFRLFSQYATQNVTIRDLLTHRSGMARHAYLWYNSHFSRKDLLHRLRYLAPACDIRQHFVYGDLPYLVAGLAVEQITQKSWEQVVSENILKPLRMKRTNFSAMDSKRDGNAAVPYVERDGMIRPMVVRDFSLIGPGGAMNSTVKDLTHWINMLLSQGVYANRPLLSPSTIQELFAGQVIVSGYAERSDILLNAYGLGWGIHAYRGHYQVSHDGGVDGFTSVVELLPNDQIGIVVLANKNLSILPRLITFEIADRILELPLRNWLQEELAEQANKKPVLEQQETESLYRKKGTSPSHSLENYVGDYEHPGYGRVTVELADGKLIASYNGIRSTLEHWHYDMFAISEDSEDLLLSRKGMKFTFQNHVNGDVGELQIPFEAKTEAIAFTKVLNTPLFDLGYLQQFLGTYEIYGVSVDIATRGRSLVAIIPGQPTYELLPLAENEFTVKSFDNYNIRFIKNSDDQVEEVWLIMPYGVYSAKKRVPKKQLRKW